MVMNHILAFTLECRIINAFFYIRDISFIIAEQVFDNGTNNQRTS